jgi:hypothetical protein
MDYTTRQLVNFIRNHGIEVITYNHEEIIVKEENKIEFVILPTKLSRIKTWLGY